MTSVATYVICNPASKVCIALIDDDDSIRRAVTRLLRTNDYGCLIYESAEAALADPGFFHAQCVVVDIQLNGMNGFEFSDRLDDLGVTMPRVFITAHIESDLPDGLGNRLLLTKPFEERQLIDSIERSLRQLDATR